MITVSKAQVEGIPYLEVVEEARKKENLPIIFFYHGWTGCKESVLVHGYELAGKGFRAILPDALYHGDRKKQLTEIEGAIQFWPIVLNSIEELAIMKQHFEHRYKAELSIGVAGLSMGGMTASGIMSHYPNVQAAAILMGSVDPSGFTKWLLQSKAVLDATKTIQLMNQEQLNHLYAQLDKISLKKNPQLIAGRPIHFWHATGDQVVPFWPTFEFFEEIKDKEFARQIDFSVTEGGSHSVPYTAIHETASFFKEKMKEEKAD